MKFTPGFLTKPQADELTKLTERPGLSDVWATPPLQMTRGPGGQPAITLPPPESWWARLTAKSAPSGIMYWSWVEVYETSAGIWADKPFGRSGTLNAQNINSYANVVGTTIKAGTTYVRMWQSRDLADVCEFSYIPAKLHGKLDGVLRWNSFASMSIWAGSAGAESDTGGKVTVYNWLSKEGPEVGFPPNLPAGTWVTAYYDNQSNYWYVDSWFNEVVVGTLLSALSYLGSTTMGVGTGADIYRVTVNDQLLNSGESLASGSRVVAAYDVSRAAWYVIGMNRPLGVGITGTRTVLDGSSNPQTVTIVNGAITAWSGS